MFFLLIIFLVGAHRSICYLIILIHALLCGSFSLYHVVLQLICLPYIYLANLILQLVKLLESKEVNHIEFCRIRNVLDEIMLMNGNAELSAIQNKLLEPASVVTGLKVDADILVSLV